MKPAQLTTERLLVLLSYDAESGVFVWNSTRGRSAKAGDVAGTAHPRGYVTIEIDGRAYLAHRLAWLFVHGCFPAEQIDHVNRDRADNRLCNLRPASHSQNMANRAHFKNNVSGFRGVYRHSPNRWRAQIRKDGVLYRLGNFDTPEEAHAAYLKAADRIHGVFAEASNG